MRVVLFLTAFFLLVAASPAAAQLCYETQNTHEHEISVLMPSMIAPGHQFSAIVLADYMNEQIGKELQLTIENASGILVYNEKINFNATHSNDFVSAVFPPLSLLNEEIYTVLLKASNGQLLHERTIEVRKGTVLLKPIFEVFTSSTCGPCASANPVLDAVLAANPNTHSLIKYQMNWPGSGDPYYTAEGGVRRQYYGVNAVPDMYINSNKLYPGSTTQAIYNSYLGQPASVQIVVSNAFIDEDNNLTVDVNIEAQQALAAGLKLHIVVVEKTTTGNVASNGETSFHNVMMKMLPNASGTTLPALSPGTPFTLSQSYDMDLTHMEEANDLAVIVFVQDNANKSVKQSEMVDVSNTLIDYTVTYNVSDSDGNPVEGASVFMQNFGTKTTNADGTVSFLNVLPGTYSYEIIAPGLITVNGSVTVVDSDLVENVVMEIPGVYFYEDFTSGIPSDWTVHVTMPDFLYSTGQVVIFFRQSSTAANPIMLVSPAIDLSPAGELMFDFGEVALNPVLAFGTVTNPNDPSTFTQLYSYNPASAWQTVTIDVSEVNGGQGEVYLAWMLPTAGMSYFSFDNVTLTYGETIEPPLFADDFEAYNAGEKLACQNPDNWTTWSNAPCGAEDPLVSNEQAFSGSNSVKIVGTSDLVKTYPDYTEGLYNISFKMYVPQGNYGYFNTLQDFNGGNSLWGMQVYFEPGGLGKIDGGGSAAATFSFAHNSWMDIRVMVDLNADWAEFYHNNTFVHGWEWSKGAFGTGNLNQLGGNNFYGWAATGGTPLYYFDDFIIELAQPLSPPVNLTAEVVNENNVVLNWDAPSKAFTGYNIYRNALLIAENISATTYTDEALMPGNYSYDVKAVYDEGLSAGAGPVNVIVAGGTDRNFVLLEIGTGTWCVFCPGAAMGADELVENDHDVVVVKYHYNDSYQTNESLSRLTSYYQVSSFPTSFFDGIIPHVGGNATQSLYPTFLNYYNQRIDQVSLFSLDAVVTNTTGTNWQVAVQAEMIYSHNASNVVLQAVLVESHIPVNWFNQTEVNFVARDMIPNANGTAMNFSTNPAQQVVLDFEVPGTYNIENCQLIVFLQDNTTKEVLQANKADLLVNTIELQSDGFELYPNPAKEFFTIKTDAVGALLKITDIHGRIIIDRIINATSTNLKTDHLAPGIYTINVIAKDAITTRKLIIE
jgi:thiol-disulfide isomerase/thioredoxin